MRNGIPFGIKFDVRGHVEVGDRIGKVLHGSPTEQIRKDIISGFYNGTGLSKIDKIVLVDTGGSERDSTTSLSYSVSGNKLTITCTISITASYTIDRVRAYSGTKLYFDTNVTNVTVYSGDKANVTLTITVNVSGSLSGGGVTWSFSDILIASTIIDVLRGTKTSPSAINVGAVRWHVLTPGGEVNWDATASETLASDGLSETVHAEYDTGGQFDIYYIALLSTGGFEICKWTPDTYPAYNVPEITLIFDCTISA